MHCLLGLVDFKIQYIVQVDLIADQVKEMAFKLPLPADNPLNSDLLRSGPCENCSPYSEDWRAWLTLMEQTSMYSYVKHLRRLFNSLDIPKAWSTAKEKIERTMRGEQPKLELLVLRVLNNAQGNNFWQSLDKVVVDLCQSRNDALDVHLYEALLSLANLYLCICVFLFVFVYLYLYVGICICVFVYLCICICICVFVSVCANLYLCICVFVYLYLYLCICICMCEFVVVYLYFCVLFVHT